MSKAKSIYRGIAILIIFVGFVLVPVSIDRGWDVFANVYIVVVIWCAAYLWFDNPLKGKEKK